MNQALQEINQGTIRKKNLIWLELSGCAGNIISLLDGSNPGFAYMIQEMVNLTFDNSLSAAQGEAAMEDIRLAIQDEYILAVEGAVPTIHNGMYTVLGIWDGEPLTALRAVKLFGEGASHIIAMGACATHGGVSGARPNPGICVGVQNVLDRKVIQLPGCPCHPDWFLGTLANLILFGEPELDSLNRPLMFYSTTVHDRCTRRSFFDQRRFARKLGDPECQYLLGCRGPVTPADCPTRRWNQYVNWPVEDDTPCIGCAQFGFPDNMVPFITFPP